MTIEYFHPPIWNLLGDGGYKPFPWQAKHIHAREEKRIILPCGRRSGKSSALVPELWKRLIRPPRTIMGVVHHPFIYCAAPTFELADKIWKPFWDSTFLPEFDALVKERGKKDPAFVLLKSGGYAIKKSADNARSLQGDAVTDLLLDEAQDVHNDSWNAVIPSLIDTDGTLIAIGIPKGRGRFRSYYEIGQSAEGHDATGVSFYSHSVPSTANPNPLIRNFVEGERQELPDIEFQQQIMAQWVDEDGLVFKDVPAAFDGGLEEPVPGHLYYVGLDLALSHDYTVAYVLDATDPESLQVVASYRVNQLEFDLVAQNVAALFHRYKASLCIMDATGLGLPVATMLRRELIPVKEYKFTNDSKASLISTLNAMLQQGRLHLPPSDDQLRKELLLYEGTLMAGGTTIRYSAPSGFYDDCVIALGLACIQASRRSGKPTKVRRYAKFNNTKKAPARSRRLARAI